MPERHLNLRDKTAVAEFIASQLEFLPENDRKPYEKILEDLEAHRTIQEDELIAVAKNIAAVSWPARRALDRFLKSVGAEFEWEALLNNLRPKTTQILKRLKKNDGVKTIDEALASTEATTLLADR